MNSLETREQVTQKLLEEKQPASWSMLEEHFQRGALLVVAEGIDLCEIGASIALDDVETIKSLMQKKQLQKCDAIDAKKFKKSPYEKIFEFIIVQPYVLIQVKWH